MHSTSYSRFSSNSCKAVMGRKGKNALAQTMERILPKLELAVILIYLSILVKVFRPSKIPLLQYPKGLFAAAPHPPRPWQHPPPYPPRYPHWPRRGRNIVDAVPKKPTVCPFCSKADTRRTFCRRQLRKYMDAFHRCAQFAVGHFVQLPAGQHGFRGNAHPAADRNRHIRLIARQDLRRDLQAFQRLDGHLCGFSWERRRTPNTPLRSYPLHRRG